MLTKDEAICLRTVDYSETSQIVTLFAKRAGKISAIAKGAKRSNSPFDGPIEMLSHGKVLFTAANKDKLATLTEFEQRPALGGLRRNLFALNHALFAAELVNSLTDEHDPHPLLYDRLLEYLHDINELGPKASASDLLPLLILFQLALLGQVGLQPVVNRCANCRKKYDGTWRETHFSSLANGLLCRDCEGAFPEKVRLTAPTARSLADWKSLSTAEESTLYNVERLLVRHFTEMLHRPPKMAKQILRKP